MCNQMDRRERAVGIIREECEAPAIEETAMLHGDLHPLIHRNPFSPFRVTMADGTSYEVRFREAFVLTPTYLMVGLLPNADGSSYERGIVLDLFSIISVEMLPAKVSAQGNGQPGT